MNFYEKKKESEYYQMPLLGPMFLVRYGSVYELFYGAF